ncbi:MAG TPA: HD domain-containing protein, partial [Actinomycetota bacterium]|nr:HD domain-containing protein [Actinomycetota bacterium]
MSQSRAAAIGPLRAALSRLMGTPGGDGDAPEELRPLLESLRRRHPGADLADVIRAYRVAHAMHAGQLRKSGEPFITHPLGVAVILADIGLDVTSVIAALLHDAVEDTDASLEELREGFGEEVAEIIDGLTKIAKIGFTSVEHAKAENYRKMMVAMARDVRVIIVKLADRLHNMRTLGALPPEKQELKASETLEIYVPLANRLGMAQMKTELEDLAFRYRYPKRYQEVVDLTERRQPERDRTLQTVCVDLREHLETAKIRADVTGRAKDYYSIYQKMVERGREFDEILDLVGIRILVEQMPECYVALGVVHALYVPIPGRLKDYIAQPKFNMYQSLHTTVMGPGGKSL